ncbi:MAG: FAD-dependent oxidoreductase [Betaproteobacteria bacterium]|nr:FAD-dependent oxidoreductase [Betaproteobacteria bacterium]
MTAKLVHILLAGGGHTHVEVLRRFALKEDPAVALTLVSPYATTPYSGMLPGEVAGHYTPAETHIALRPLAAWANARFIEDRVVALDLDAYNVRLASGAVEPFDLLSLDIGSSPDMSVAGAREYAVGVKPVEQFLTTWQSLQQAVATNAVQTIAVVGGGAGGVELLLAMQFRLCSLLGNGVPRFALFTDQPHLLPQHSAAVRTRFRRLLVERDIDVHVASAVQAVESKAVVTASGRRIAADCIVWATSAGAQPWVAASGLACDSRGFVRLDAHLRSTSHAFVFAAGDCATQVAHPRPKSGVFAVRQGPPLAANLRHAAHAEPLELFVPQKNHLALISTGGRHAIMSWGPFMLEGDWVWRWKDRLDRAFIAKLTPPAAPKL